MTMKQIKFANKWYKVHDTKFSLGINWYKIEDEPNHFDWISENSVQGYEVIMPTYNGDIMHCRQHLCCKKDQCYRYWLGQECSKYDGLVSMYRPKHFEYIKGMCEYFLNIKEY